MLTVKDQDVRTGEDGEGVRDVVGVELESFAESRCQFHQHFWVVFLYISVFRSFSNRMAL